MEDERETTTLRTRRKKSSSPLNLSSCFSGHSSADPDYHHFPSSSTSSLVLSPSSWFRSKASGTTPARTGHRRRHHSADFSYDALSYSLNFDDGHDDFLFSWLPATPRREPLRDLELPPGRRCGARSTAMSPLNKDVEKNTKVVPGGDSTLDARDVTIS